MMDLARLEAHLAGMRRVVLGFSGGVDSSLLALAGVRALGRERFIAVTGRSASLAGDQWQSAEALADHFGIPLATVDTGELDDPRYAANPENRCYYCKAELWRRLRAFADARGFDTVIDGTNADDLGEHRPGLAAAAEHRVRSPLAELGWTKLDVRRAAQALGLPNWEAPAAPCLSSRIRYGLPVTPERLRQVERAEALLRGLGIGGDLRVRHLGDVARVEVRPEYFEHLDHHWLTVERGLRLLGFERVERDPRGYRRGALLVLGAA